MSRSFHAVLVAAYLRATSGTIVLQSTRYRAFRWVWDFDGGFKYLLGMRLLCGYCVLKMQSSFETSVQVDYRVKLYILRHPKDRGALQMTWHPETQKVILAQLVLERARFSILFSGLDCKLKVSRQAQLPRRRLLQLDRNLQYLCL